MSDDCTPLSVHERAALSADRTWTEDELAVLVPAVEQIVTDARLDAERATYRNLRSATGVVIQNTAAPFLDLADDWDRACGDCPPAGECGSVRHEHASAVRALADRLDERAVVEAHRSLRLRGSLGRARELSLAATVHRLQAELDAAGAVGAEDQSGR